jgi:hypothetical protein
MSTHFYQLHHKRAVARTSALAAAVAMLLGLTGAAYPAQATTSGGYYIGSRRIGIETGADLLRSRRLRLQHSRLRR